MKKLVQVFKALGAVLGTLILVQIAYFYYSLATAQDRMTAVCSEIHAGMDAKELTQFGAEHGLKGTHFKDGNNYLPEGRTMGRYSCEVVMESGKVKSSILRFLD